MIKTPGTFIKAVLIILALMQIMSHTAKPLSWNYCDLLYPIRLVAYMFGYVRSKNYWADRKKFVFSSNFRHMFCINKAFCRAAKGLPTNRNGLLGRQAELAGATGPPTRQGGAKLRVDPQNSV
jgi:hypothetical protein